MAPAEVEAFSSMMTPERLRRTAGARYFDRGEAYFAAGAVRSLRAHEGGVKAVVQGTRRAGRNIELTLEGSVLFREVRAGIERIELGIAKIQKSQERQAVRLQSYMSISSRWLMPRLARLREKHPALRIELYTSQLEWHFRREHADAGFIYTESRERGLFYYPLRRDHLVAVCSPTFLHRFGEVKDPSDLLKLPIIKTGDGGDHLEKWFQAAGITIRRDNITQTIDTHFVALEAACAGEGLVVVHSLFAERDIEAGNILRPLPHNVSVPGMWYLVCESWRRDDQRIKRIAHWLADELRVSKR
jgi:LysR family glycine cleavage system transcriptional activator